MTRPERRSTFKMLFASTFLIRRSRVPPTVPSDQVAELAVIAAAETLEATARLGLQAAPNGPAVHRARLHLAAARALTRALFADYEARTIDHIQDIVDRLDTTIPPTPKGRTPND